MNHMKEELHVFQTTKPSFAIETDAKLVDLEDRSRRNNRRFEEIMEHENESLEDSENKIYNLLEQASKSNKHIEPEGRTRIDRPILVQFSIFEDFSRERERAANAWKSGRKFLMVEKKVCYHN